MAVEDLTRTVQVAAWESTSDITQYTRGLVNNNQIGNKAVMRIVEKT